MYFKMLKQIVMASSGSHDPSEMILNCCSRKCLIIINVKNMIKYIFVETVILFFQESSKEQHLLEIDCFVRL